MVAYFEDRLARIDKTADTFSSSAAPSDARQASLQKGKQFLLDGWRQHMSSLLAEAIQCRQSAA